MRFAPPQGSQGSIALRTANNRLVIDSTATLCPVSPAIGSAPSTNRPANLSMQHQQGTGSVYSSGKRGALGHLASLADSGNRSISGCIPEIA
jgi:hypothetical protein